MRKLGVAFYFMAPSYSSFMIPNIYYNNGDKYMILFKTANFITKKELRTFVTP